MTKDKSTCESPADPDAEYFAQVTSGIYRRVNPESVWLAVRFAIRHKLPAENPTIMMMFVRIAEFYPEVRSYLQAKIADVDDAERAALQLIFEPPEGIRNAEYLPLDIQSPGEMDMCWSEFLVTGSTEAIEKVVAVLDREDLTRAFINSQLLPKESHPDQAQPNQSPELELDDDERNELASVGIALGHTGGPWQVMSPGDIDVLLWFGLKDKNKTCSRIMNLMDQDLVLHMANKGAALWSLKANASQHGKIRLFCEEQAKIPGGVGRLLIDPTT